MPRLGLPGSTTVAWGTHLCLFYKSQSELRQLIAPYFHAGLTDDECCVWITAAPLTELDALGDLTRIIPNTQAYLDSGQLMIAPSTEWYLRNGVFDANQVVRAWTERLEWCVANGYTGLRIAGDAGWLSTEEEQRDAFMAYEQLVTDSAVNKKMIAICAYPTASYAPDDMLTVMQCHHSVVLPASAGWKAVEVCCT